MLSWDWAYNSYHWSSISLSQHNKTEQRKHTIIEVSKGDCIIMGVLTMVKTPKMCNLRRQTANLTDSLRIFSIRVTHGSRGVVFVITYNLATLAPSLCRLRFDIAFSQHYSYY